jgi:hypothetical protein
MTKLHYKGFEINAVPYQLADTGHWTVHIFIWKHRGHESTEREFSAANTFENKEDAIKHCLNFGKQIIDGQAKGCSVEDL